MKNVVASYSEDAISRAKKGIHKSCKTKPAVGKACASHPNVNTKYVEDMLDLIASKERSQVVVPTHAASGYSSKPTIGFESIAPTILALRDEIASLRAELNEQSQATQMNRASCEQFVAFTQD